MSVCLSWGMTKGNGGGRGVAVTALLVYSKCAYTELFEG